MRPGGILPDPPRSAGKRPARVSRRHFARQINLVLTKTSDHSSILWRDYTANDASFRLTVAKTGERQSQGPG